MAFWFARAPRDDEQAALLEKLRDRFSEETIREVGDGMLRKFLVAQSWKLEAAATMLQGHLTWRAEFLPVPREEVQPILDEQKLALLGNDTDGHPVFVVSLAKLNGVDWKKEGEMERHIRAMVHLIEQMRANMPAGIDTWTSVVDCQGITAPPQAFLTRLSSVMEANYPEQLHKAVMYPIPWVVVQLVSAMLVMLPEATRKKFCFVESQDSLCKETGLAVDQLPADLTGLSAEDAKMLKDAKTVDVVAGNQVVHQVAVEEGQLVKWMFRVVEYDVNFTLRFATSAAETGDSGNARSSSTKGEEVAAQLRLTLSHLERVSEGNGEHKAERAGILEFVVDNSFSMLRSKSVLLGIC